MIQLLFNYSHQLIRFILDQNTCLWSQFPPPTPLHLPSLTTTIVFNDLMKHNLWSSVESRGLLLNQHGIAQAHEITHIVPAIYCPKFAGIITLMTNPAHTQLGVV